MLKGMCQKILGNWVSFIISCIYMNYVAVYVYTSFDIVGKCMYLIYISSNSVQFSTL